MDKEITEGIGDFYQHLCRLPAILTAQAKGRNNAMAVSRQMLISTNPPLCGVSILSKRFTYQLIADSKEFGLNFLPFELAKLIDSVGSISGQEVDKFQRFNIAVDKAVKTAVPVLKDAYAACECRLSDDLSYGDHRLLIGEIVAVHLLREALTPKKVLDLDKVSPALFLGSQHYVTPFQDTVKYVERP